MISQALLHLSHWTFFKCIYCAIMASAVRHLGFDAVAFLPFSFTLVSLMRKATVTWGMKRQPGGCGARFHFLITRAREMW